MVQPVFRSKFKSKSEATWWEKNNRHVSSIFGLGFFFIFFIIALYSQISKNLELENLRIFKNKTEIMEKNISVFGSTKNTGNYCILRNTFDVTCRNFKSDFLIERINAVIGEMKNQNINLMLQNISINNDISLGWLLGLKANVVTLTFDQEYFQIKTKRSAFLGDPFSHLNALYFTKYNNVIMRTSDFTGVTVTELNIACLYPMLNVERTFLEAFDFLQSLVLNECLDSSAMVLDLVGDRNMSKKFAILTTLDLRHNIINEVPPRAFFRGVNLQAIYLSDSWVQTVSPNAFDGLKALRMVNLNNNKITKLPIELFYNTQTTLYLSGNLFNCSCDFVWFQCLYNKCNQIDKCSDELKCLGGDLLVSHQFCTTEIPPKTPFCGTTVHSCAMLPCTSVSTSTELPKTTKVTTSVSPKGTVPTTQTTSVKQQTEQTGLPIQKDLGSEIIELISTKGECNTNHSLALNITDSNSPFNITKYGSETTIKQDYLVQISNPEHKFLVLFQHTVPQCHKNLPNNFLLTLTRMASYNACIVEESTGKIQVCHEFDVPPVLSEQAWIKNRLKYKIIALISALVFLGIILAIIATYFCIWRYPKLLRRSKNFVVIQPQGQQPPRAPPRAPLQENKTRLRDRENLSCFCSLHTYNTVTNMSCDGYMTPKCCGKKKVAGRQTSVEFEMSRSHFYESVFSPPPLPPNHPVLRDVVEN